MIPPDIKAEVIRLFAMHPEQEKVVLYVPTPGGVLMTWVYDRVYWRWCGHAF